MISKRILITDDEPIILKIISEELISEGYDVEVANDGSEALLKFKEEKFDLVILDNRMPNKSGIEVLEEIMKTGPDVAVIMMTAFGTINNAVEAMKLGAYDYITKPFDNDELICKVKEALQIKEVIGSNTESNMLDHQLIGSSDEVERIRNKIYKIKDLDTTVLITGESGTGKGVIARDIHHLGSRKNEPFVHVNCAVLPVNLIESELFGHEKGSFTGAIESKKGKFELAGNGTIFLDEIGTLDHALQAKLLTVLQEKRFERIGSGKTIYLGARIIAATNENLEVAVRNKSFREDLYYRVNVISIECPPLRYMKEDIKKLSMYFINELNTKLGKQIEEVSLDVWKVFMKYDWPGNVRELENTLESSIAMSNGKKLMVEDLPLRVKRQLIEVEENVEYGDKSILEMEEIKAIKKSLKKNDNHREKTAKDLGISRRTLQYKLKKYGLLK
jgi:DNA-binding NtrC family response regulator